MDHRRLGSTGLRVSALTLGTRTWGSRIDPATAAEHLRTFLAAGGSVLDTAHSYGPSEDVIGSLLRDVDRDDVIVCSKAGIGGPQRQRRLDPSRRAMLSQLETSLARLGTDYLDLWLVHAWSDEVPLEETLGALEWAVQSGRARYVGVSNYSGWQATRAWSLLGQARVAMATDQVEYSLLDRRPEHELTSAARALGFGVMAYAPLGAGVLTGKYRNGIPADSRAASDEFGAHTRRLLTDPGSAVVEALVIAAKGLGVTPAEVALAWVRERSGVATSVVGVRTAAQLAAAISSTSLSLPPEIVEALDEVSRPALAPAC